MSYRIMQKFWLDLEKPNHAEVNEIIHTFKKTRAYSKAIRDGLHLIFDLRAGRLGVLFELFPWVRAEFLEHMSTLQPQPIEPHFALQEQLSRLESMLIEQGSLSINEGTEFQKSRPGEPTQMAVPKVTAPVFDNEGDLLIVTPAAASGNAAQNFIDSAFKLVQ